ncbi:MAG TPA: peptide ABC transporter ATP-binding protein [Ruminococcaceae bacterium]|nr:peptide ABC transporter ATP-binding protein [Oscillospiraceae bacterium]
MIIDDRQYRVTLAAFVSVGKLRLIFQDPMSSLNPRKKVRDLIGAGLDIHHKYGSKEERSSLIGEYLMKVGLSPEQGDRYPAQFSGGQRQRVGIARALIMQPKLIIADECIAALDASIQAQVVNLLKKLCKESGTSMLFISHDLSMVHYISDKIGVLHLGYLLETGSSDAVFSSPVHPYTRNLLASVPRPDPIMQSHVSEGYDPVSSGIIYENGSWHSCESDPTHKVWCTDEEWKKWGEEK